MHDVLAQIQLVIASVVNEPEPRKKGFEQLSKAMKAIGGAVKLVGDIPEKAVEKQRFTALDICVTRFIVHIEVMIFLYQVIICRECKKQPYFWSQLPQIQKFKKFRLNYCMFCLKKNN